MSPRYQFAANDVHPGRLSSLNDALKRANLPKEVMENLIITNHDGSKFPPIKISNFDKVLVDVPCSGDGTIRKDSSILPRWSPTTSNALHPLQCSIGLRGLELTEVGGIMCYSTCTFNPIEDEAVIAEIIRRAEVKAGKGCVTVEEWGDDILPGMVKRSGVCDWRVADFVETGEEEEEDVPEESKGEVRNTRFTIIILLSTAPRTCT